MYKLKNWNIPRLKENVIIVAVRYTRNKGEKQFGVNWRVVQKNNLSGKQRYLGVRLMRCSKISQNTRWTQKALKNTLANSTTTFLRKRIYEGSI